MCCPLKYYKGRLAEFKAYPGMVRAYLRAAWKFMSSREDSDVVKNYNGNVYQYFYANVFFDNYAQYQQWLMTQKAFRGVFLENLLITKSF